MSTPDNPGSRPSLLGHGPAMLYLDSTGGSGPAAVRILLDPHVR